MVDLLGSFGPFSSGHLLDCEALEGTQVKFHKDAKKIWRRISVQCMGWALGFLGWWESPVGDDLKAVIGTKVALLIIGFLLVAGIVGSAIEQPKVRSEGNS
jgi:hypothetical protein